LGHNVAKGKAAIVFVDNIGGNFAADNFGKNGIGHGVGRNGVNAMRA
jgi:hypothetical protein